MNKSVWLGIMLIIFAGSVALQMSFFFDAMDNHDIPFMVWTACCAFWGLVWTVVTLEKIKEVSREQ